MNSSQTFMEIAKLISQRSNCVGGQVGAVIVKDDRILSTGYNGTPTGFHNCNDVWGNESHPEHYEWSKIYEIHAEQNAIIWAARKGISIEGGTIYTTMRPCSQCTKLIIGSGIKKIYYTDVYGKEIHMGRQLEDFINDNNIEIHRINV